MSWLLSPSPKNSSRHRGGENLGKGIEFQQGFAVNQLTCLLDAKSNLIAVRYEGMQDVDLLFRNENEDCCEFVQLKYVAQSNYTTKTLSPILASFMADLQKAGIDAPISFRLVASGTTNTDQVRRMRIGTASAIEKDVSDVEREIAELLPEYKKLAPPTRFAFAEALLRKLQLDFGAGDFGELHRPFEADAMVRLQQYGIHAEDTHAALDILRGRLKFNSEFRASDVRKAIGHLQARAVTRALDPMVRWVSDDLAAPIEEEEIAEYYFGRRVSWSFIASNGDMPRDQIGDLKAILHEKPTRLRMVTVVGSPGAGKSTLAWRAAWDIYHEDDLPVLHIQEGASSTVWIELPHIYDLLNRPFMVLVDDIFRIESIDLALKAISATLPITILCTSRANEYRPPVIDGERLQLNVNPPSDEEINKLLIRFDKPIDAINSSQRKKLRDPGEFLALLMLVSLGEDFDQYVARTIATLESYQSELSTAYATLSLAGAFDIVAPEPIIRRLNPEVFHDLDRRDITRKIIYAAPEAGFLRVGHALIAEAVLRHYRQSRSLTTLAERLIMVIEPKRDSERIFFVNLSRQLAVGGWVDMLDLKRCMTTLIKSNLDHFFCGELGSLSKTFEVIGWIEESSLCRSASWGAKVQTGADLSYLVRVARLERREAELLARPLDLLTIESAPIGITPWLGVVESNGTAEQRSLAILSTARWLEEHPSDNYVRRKYLGLATSQGTTLQIESALSETEKWLNEHPEDSIVLGSFLSTVTRKGTRKQIESAILKTSGWLSRHGEDNFVRTAYLGVVDQKGTPEEVRVAISDAAEWLSANIENTSVRAKYLDLVSGHGNSNEIGDAIANSDDWLSNHLEDTFVREKYLGVVERKGNPLQIGDAISKMAQWLENHPGSGSVRRKYLGLVDRNGSRGQIESAIDSTAEWLAGDVEDASVREKFLAIVERKGNRRQIGEAIDVTAEWLRSHPEPNNVRAPYLSLVNFEGSRKQIDDAIVETGTWLQSNPDNVHVRAKYLVILEQRGTTTQIDDVLFETVIWLDEHPKDTNVRGAYLIFVESKGNPKQIENAIANTSRWLDDHPQDSNVRASYIGIVGRKGSNKEIEEALVGTAAWLDLHPDDNFVRAAYIGFVERSGTLDQLRVALSTTAEWLLAHPKDVNVRVAYQGVLKRKGLGRQ